MEALYSCSAAVLICVTAVRTTLGSVQIAILLQVSCHHVHVYMDSRVTFSILQTFSSYIGVGVENCNRLLILYT